MRAQWLFVSALVLGCATTQNETPNTKIENKPQSAAGVVNPELKALIERHWTWTMKSSPTWATQLGITDYNDKISDNSFIALKKHAEERLDFLNAADAILPDSLSSEDRVTPVSYTHLRAHET